MWPGCPCRAPGERQEFAIAGRRCTVESFTAGAQVALVFDCAELEPGNTARFQVRLLQDTDARAVADARDDSPAPEAGLHFSAPSPGPYYQCEFTLPGAAETRPPNQPTAWRCWCLPNRVWEGSNATSASSTSALRSSASKRGSSVVSSGQNRQVLNRMAGHHLGASKPRDARLNARPKDCKRWRHCGPRSFSSN